MGYKWGASVTTGSQPQGITFGDGTLWVANRTSGTVTRVDPATLAVTATIIVPLAKLVQYAFGHCWVGDDSLSSTIHKIDPVTNTVVATKSTVFTLEDLSFNGTYLYYTFTYFGVAAMVALDPTTLVNSGGVSGVSTVTAGATGANSLWISDTSGIIKRYDETTRALQATITLPAGSYANVLTYSFGSIWAGVVLGNSPFSSVERIDPATNTIIAATMDFGNSFTPLYFATQTAFLWVGVTGYQVWQIDPSSNTFTDSLNLPSLQNPAGMGTDSSNDVWVSYGSGIHRIEPFGAAGWVRGHAWG